MAPWADQQARVLQQLVALTLVEVLDRQDVALDLAFIAQVDQVGVAAGEVSVTSGKPAQVPGGLDAVPTWHGRRALVL